MQSINWFHLHLYRPLNKVCGFTRETLIGIIANVESQELVRQKRAQLQIPPEHPRSSSTDDVECFFSVMRDLVGKSFVLRKVWDEWRKINEEYSKRLNRSLPFYYHSAAHDRFYEGDKPQFNKPRSTTTRLEQARPARREMGALHAIGRASIVSNPVRGSQHIRQKFHNLPVPLPQPPALHHHNY